MSGDEAIDLLNGTRFGNVASLFIGSGAEVRGIPFVGGYPISTIRR